MRVPAGAYRIAAVGAPLPGVLAERIHQNGPGMPHAIAGIALAGVAGAVVACRNFRRRRRRDRG